CRATNYISAIKKAIISAGFDNIPVVSVSFGSGIVNQQPGFELKWTKSFVMALYSMLFVDSLFKLYYPAAVREKEKGAAKKLKDKYLKLASVEIENHSTEGFYRLLENAIDEFSSIIDMNAQRPVIGVVGEIYVKYNSFSHKNVVEWLIDQGIEVIAPSIYNFFICEFVNLQIKKKQHISSPNLPIFITDFIYGIIQKQTHKFDKLCSRFPHYRPFSDLEKDAQNASKIINLAAQFGEGWLIAAEIASFAEQGIHNTISLQPFGCIANHVISKGIEKRIKKTYPKMNLLFLDFDGGTSETNVLNRLHFMIDGCKKKEEGL
ncbi:MAG: 2-hydroxyglutaryl-CoA dehydratase, partial [Bacteroidales bacterium]